MTAEEWRPVAGCPGYEVSNLGRIVSHRRSTPRVLSPRIGTAGYLTVSLSRGGRGAYKYALVHRLVAEAFCGPAEVGEVVRHLDGDRLNNTAANLRFGTAAENAQDMLRHGRHHYARRSHCKYGHPYDAANTSVDRTSPTARRCLTCHRTRQARRTAAHRANAEAAS